MRSQVRPRVLIVDDDPWIRASLTLLLSDVGYETLAVRDGVEALDAVLVGEERRVAVLDLLMPHMTGLEVLTHVATDDHLATQHGYIVCSAEARTAEYIGPHFVALLQCLNVPFSARPFDIDVLVQVVEEIACRLLIPEEATGACGKGRAKGRQHLQHSA